jgi:hypothetical protein
MAAKNQSRGVTQFEIMQTVAKIPQLRCLNIAAPPRVLERVPVETDGSTHRRASLGQLGRH